MEAIKLLLFLVDVIIRLKTKKQQQHTHTKTLRGVRIVGSNEGNSLKATVFQQLSCMLSPIIKYK